VCAQVNAAASLKLKLLRYFNFRLYMRLVETPRLVVKAPKKMFLCDLVCVGIASSTIICGLHSFFKRIIM